MSARVLQPRLAQALAALGVAGAIAGLVLIFLSSALGAFAAKTKALAAHRETARGLEERLVAAREETKTRLDALGAGPADLEILADAARAGALLKRACEDTLGLENAAPSETPSPCAITEAPGAGAYALYQARATFSGDIGTFTARLPGAVRPPARVTSMTIEAGASDPIVALTLEVPGARLGGAE